MAQQEPSRPKLAPMPTCPLFGMDLKRLDAELYEAWMRLIPEGAGPAAYPDRLGQLLPLYGGCLPVHAATVLDHMLSGPDGTVPLVTPDGAITQMPLSVMVETLSNVAARDGRTPSDPVELLHQMHAGGALVVCRWTVSDSAGDPVEVPAIRLIVADPLGGPWGFFDDLPAETRSYVIEVLTDKQAEMTAGRGEGEA